MRDKDTSIITYKPGYGYELSITHYLYNNKMSLEDFQKNFIDGFGKWHHRFCFEEGIENDAGADSDFILSLLNLLNLVGKSVIDIGTFEGFYAFQAMAKGAIGGDQT